jgi:tetratricopeptide (TPR) repeat protein
MRLSRLIVLLAFAMPMTEASAEEWRELYDIGLKAAREFEYELAETNLQLAFDAAKESDASPIEIGRIMDALAETHFHGSCRRKAEDAYRRSLDFKRLQLGERHSSVADTLLGLSEVLFSKGEEEQSAGMIKNAIEIRRESFGDRDPTVSEALIRLGWHYEGTGRLTEAEQTFREAIAVVVDCSKPVKEYYDALLGLKAVLKRQARIEESQNLQPVIDDVIERLPNEWWSKPSVCEREVELP